MKTRIVTFERYSEKYKFILVETKNHSSGKRKCSVSMYVNDCFYGNHLVNSDEKVKEEIKTFLQEKLELCNRIINNCKKTNDYDFKIMATIFSALLNQFNKINITTKTIDV